MKPFRRVWRALFPCIIVALALTACGPNPTPAPTPTPIPPTPTPVNDDLARVRAAGKLLVGTSADYPPFSFYTPSFVLDGFDIALMHDLARRIGVTAEFQDYAFDGVLDALRLGQVDSAAAALSVTPERQAVVDFTNYYYIGEDGIVARANSNITAIRALPDLAPFRVGVQRGSVYETLLRQTLVQTGQMPASNLMTYENAAQAMDALRNQQVDVVMADRAPLDEALANSPNQFKLVGQNLNVQRLAFAVRKGSNLAGALNQALVSAQNDGTVTNLIQRYFNLTPGQIPTPPPFPTPTPGVIVVAPTPAGCIDGMSFVADLNYPDNNMKNPPVLQPGQPFQKGWRVRNSGTCTWTTAYTFAYAGGNSPLAQMGGQPQGMARPVPPGQVVDFYVNLIAPTTPGVYQGFWQMRNAQGRAFGTRVWVGIQVPAPTAPTPTPGSGIIFTANTTQVTPGQPVVFSWNAQGAVAVYFYADGQPWQQFPVPPVGQQTVYPQVTTTYNLRALLTNGSTEIRQIQIQVVGGGGGNPVIQNFVITPGYQITLGQCVNITWNVTGNANSVRLTRNSTVIVNNGPINGSIQECPPQTGEYVYTLQAIGTTGQATAQRILNVITQPGQGPVINSFNVSPNQFPTNSCTTVSWNVSNATFVSVTRNNVGLPQATSASALTGSFQDCISTPGNYVYQLQAQSASGQTAVQQRTANVFNPVFGATPQP